jgi:hypothetical protein
MKPKSGARSQEEKAIPKIAYLVLVQLPRLNLRAFVGDEYSIVNLLFFNLVYGFEG